MTTTALWLRRGRGGIDARSASLSERRSPERKDADARPGSVARDTSFMFARRRTLPVVVASVCLGVLGGCASTATQTSSAPAGAASSTTTAAPSAVTPSAVTTPSSTQAEAGASAPDVSASTATSSAPSTSGAYITYADYVQNPAAVTGKVVLFFHATWCSICQEVDRSLTSAAVPSGLTVVKVDYDSSDQLRQRYGVTIQHTFVQVDTSGNPLRKWSTGTLADQILAKTV